MLREESFAPSAVHLIPADESNKIFKSKFSPSLSVLDQFSSEEVVPISDILSAYEEADAKLAELLREADSIEAIQKAFVTSCGCYQGALTRLSRTDQQRIIAIVAASLSLEEIRRAKSTLPLTLRRDALLLLRKGGVTR